MKLKYTKQCRTKSKIHPQILYLQDRLLKECLCLMNFATARPTPEHWHSHDTAALNSTPLWRVFPGLQSRDLYLLRTSGRAGDNRSNDACERYQYGHRSLLDTDQMPLIHWPYRVDIALYSMRHVFRAAYLLVEFRWGCAEVQTNQAVQLVKNGDVGNERRNVGVMDEAAAHWNTH